MSQNGPHRTSLVDVVFGAKSFLGEGAPLDMTYWRTSGAVAQCQRCATVKPPIYTVAQRTTPLYLFAGLTGVLQRRFLWLEDCVRRVSGLYVLKPNPFFGAKSFLKNRGALANDARAPEGGRGGARTGRMARLTIGCIVLGADGGTFGAGAPAMRRRGAGRRSGRAIGVALVSGSGGGDNGRRRAKIGGVRVGAQRGWRKRKSPARGGALVGRSWRGLSVGQLAFKNSDHIRPG